MTAPNWIALRHVYPNGADSIRVQPRERLERLVEVAQPGDTLHKLDDSVITDPPALFKEVRRQVVAGEFVPV